jgi:hypothetical protein
MFWNLVVWDFGPHLLVMFGIRPSSLIKPLSRLVALRLAQMFCNRKALFISKHKQVISIVHLSTRTACSSIMPEQPLRPSNKETFKYIQAYLSIFEVFLKNIQRICPVCLAHKDVMDMSVCPSSPLGMSDCLWIPSMTTLNTGLCMIHMRRGDRRIWDYNVCRKRTTTLLDLINHGWKWTYIVIGKPCCKIWKIMVNLPT